MKERYQLRSAIGTNWLLDMEQERFCYKPPVTINDTGRFIWEMLCRGSSTEHIVKAFSLEYGIDELQAQEDVQMFTEQMIRQGILEEGQ